MVTTTSHLGLPINSGPGCLTKWWILAFWNEDFGYRLHIIQGPTSLSPFFHHAPTRKDQYTYPQKMVFILALLCLYSGCFLPGMLYLFPFPLFSKSWPSCRSKIKVLRPSGIFIWLPPPDPSLLWNCLPHNIDTCVVSSSWANSSPPLILIRGWHLHSHPCRQPWPPVTHTLLISNLSLT